MLPLAVLRFPDCSPIGGVAEQLQINMKAYWEAISSGQHWQVAPFSIEVRKARHQLVSYYTQSCTLHHWKPNRATHSNSRKQEKPIRSVQNRFLLARPRRIDWIGDRQGSGKRQHYPVPVQLKRELVTFIVSSLRTLEAQ